MVEDATKTLADRKEERKPLEEEREQLKEKFDNNKKELMELQVCYPS